MTKPQQGATIAGRLVGMTASMYFWFVMNNYGSNHPVHKSVFAASIEGEYGNTVTTLCFLVASTLFITLISGFIFRLLFSFGEAE